MPIQKRILPLWGLLILTQNHGLANWWNNAADTLATKGKAWVAENPDTIKAAEQAAGGAVQAGVKQYQATENFKDAAKGAGAAFQTGMKTAQATASTTSQTPGTLQQQAEQKLIAFKQLPHVTPAQKTVLQEVYQQQQYQVVITVIDQTNDVFAMLGRTSDAVKKQKESDLTQMSSAFNQVTSSDIVSVTQNVHTYVKSIAPPAPDGTLTTSSSTSSMTDAEFEQKVISVINKNIGPIIDQHIAKQKQAPNMFIGG